ncbi:hypothetical protein NL532_15840 [Mesorhizobium sp. C120A]|uniref:hypothetical protein n=1 Tax=unclassified Mesorhizobium TaxID=325217 RepID=UPI0003D03F5E|nr:MULTISPECIES: hypothetical protein [unclassified Mesorhizobium]ESZ55606.1 hypothetical protein X728_28930 [Mesorhizobium sp. L103C120A0]WJI47996.1 hypothetical protein NL532_15840 [Mesorhizobium sp. C120A]
MGGAEPGLRVLFGMIGQLQMLQDSTPPAPRPTVDDILSASVSEGVVYSYLVYLSEPALRDDVGRRKSMAALRRIGKIVPADMNVFVVETDRHYATVYAILLASFSKKPDLFVAELSSLMHSGSLQFHKGLGSLIGPPVR